MICKPCNVAGDLVAISRQNENFKDEALGLRRSPQSGTYYVNTHEAVKAIAHLYHGLCKGRSHCDCQHKVDFEGRTIQNGQA